MSNKVVALNQTNVSLRMRILADSTGVPNTGVNNSTTGLDIWYQRGENTAAVSGGVSTSDLSAVTDAHTDWGFVHVNDGWYRVDFPDAAFIESSSPGVSSVLCGIGADSFTGISVTVDIDPFYKYQGVASAVTTLTTHFPAGTTPLKGDHIMVLEGTGDPGNMVMVTSVSADEAIHPAFSTGISATTTTILLIAGSETAGQGGYNVDVAVSSAATQADVSAAVAIALASANIVNEAYIDAQTSTQAVQYAALSSSQTVLETGVNVSSINDVTVIGVGTSANLWRA